VSQQRIVILGGGFAGVYTAMRLERRLKRRDDVELSLVSRDNYLVFQPLIPEVVSSSIGLLDTIAPLRRLCPRTRLYTREIDAIDLSARTVTLRPGVRPRPVVLEFDHLVIALGNIPALGALPGVREHAMPFKSLGDALHIRNHVLNVLEEAAIEPDRDTRRALMTFVVAGGGFSGVELGAELNDFVREVVRDYRGLEPADLQVSLLHSGDQILPELDPSLGQFAHRLLAKRGVDIRLGTRLAGATASAALLSTGDRVPARTIVTTVPSGPNPLLETLAVELQRGRLPVDAHLAVPGLDRVWALGDCAAVTDPRTGRPAPPTAQHAIREARCAADNILATIDGTAQTSFSFSTLGQLASLGRRSAVAQVFGLKLSGIVAWWLWRTVYLMKLPGLDRKLRVATDWTLDLFLRQDIVQLKTDRTTLIAAEHFDAGEQLVRQGDFGDKLYVIRRGRVEVCRERPAQEPEQLAVLEEGDYFGETALLEEATRNSTITALTAVDVLTIGRGDFQALLLTVPALRPVFEDLARARQQAAGPKREAE
jgi:NADH dehydrogenase